ncbi:uroporphyrin-III C-methyltransferase [Thiohalobacter thiocyanaticus]|uniref:Uroporphyrin-III C-methyltransferase n=1 Tax=Thiohalobacter thiocyanaticus TaxID=585455 RepID=A0A1Z4VM93_9GAMM|nr:uroporphyrinogen-III C-methyltransferase [Thiohalobacter thiocyanaticus]BAZ92731.1 uroporphyrin-III C-methyltransferase [Thiohalobacter thiocyanaticus]
MSENKDKPQPQGAPGSGSAASEGGGKPRSRGGRRRSPSAPSTAAGGASQAPAPTGGRYAGPLAILALLVGVGALVAGYFIWHEVQRQAGWQQEVLAQIDARNQALDNRVTAAVDRMEATLDEAVGARRGLQQDLADQQQSIAALERAFGVLRAQVGRSQEAWVLAEAEYLLHVANQRLQLARDVDTAIAALTSADQRLQELANAAYLPVREQISRELAGLRGVDVPDIDGIALRLQTLADSVDDLKVAGAQYRPTPRGAAADAGAEADAEAGSWRELPAALWGELRQLVAVRRNDEPVAPLLAPDQQFFLYANLRLQLDTARLAALRGNPELYRVSLRTARDWLAQEFDAGQPAVREARAELDALLAVELRPALPDIAGSLRLLRQELALIEAGRAAPEAASDEAAAEGAGNAP